MGMSVVASTFVAPSGDGYELQMGRWSRRLAEPFLDFCGCGDGETILDAGCGTGALTAAIMKRTKTTRIAGIDFSDAYVDYAKRTVSDPRAQFSVGDISAVPYDNAAFDRVLSLLSPAFCSRKPQSRSRTAPRRASRRNSPALPFGMPEVWWPTACF
jgi:SAM-dependent methyltransferase